MNGPRMAAANDIGMKIFGDAGFRVLNSHRMTVTRREMAHPDGNHYWREGTTEEGLQLRIGAWYWWRCFDHNSDFRLRYNKPAGIICDIIPLSPPQNLTRLYRKRCQSERGWPFAQLRHAVLRRLTCCTSTMRMIVYCISINCIVTLERMRSATFQKKTRFCLQLPAQAPSPATHIRACDDTSIEMAWDYSGMQLLHSAAADPQFFECAL